MEAISIIKRNSETGKFELVIEVLEYFFNNQIDPDCNISIISIAGALRKGKSFMLNFFIRYLRASVEEQENGEWIKLDEPLTNGFHWKNGSTADTSGILIWPEIFYQIDNLMGNKNAIILMDTQGIFDRSCSIQENILIFAFSTMLTSVQIFNISQLIQEDNLQYLQLFAEYGKLASETSNETPFQKLVFLVRDWQDDENYPYGLTGGKRYIDECLEYKLDQPKDIGELRSSIRSSFDKLDCFLMPHPGLKVAKCFNGDLNQIEEEVFIEVLNEFLKSIFSNSNYVPKKLNGEMIIASDFINYVTSFWKIFEDTPTPQLLLELTVNNACHTAKSHACKTYDEKVLEATGEIQPHSNNVLSIIHSNSETLAIKIFNERTRLGEDRLKIHFREELKIYFDQKFTFYKEMNDEKRSIARNQLLRATAINVAGIVGVGLSVVFAICRLIFRV